MRVDTDEMKSEARFYIVQVRGEANAPPPQPQRVRADYVDRRGTSCKLYLDGKLVGVFTKVASVNLDPTGYENSP